jgi:ubiquitin C-terminal hydrolase
MKEAAICTFCKFIHCKRHLNVHFYNSGHFLALDLIESKPICLKCSFSEPDPKNLKMSNFIQQKGQEKSSSSLISVFVSCFQDSNLSGKQVNYDFDPHLQPVVRGMSNLGNTCFFNSTIQALRNNTDFSNFIAKLVHFFPDTSVFRGLNTLFQQFEKKKVVDASSFIKLFSKKWKNIKAKQQQDPHEFLTLLLSAILDELESCDEEHAQELKGYFKQTFLGTSTVRTECENCAHSNEHDENFTSLTLPLFSPDENQRLTLDYLLENFTKSTNVGSFKCEKCNEKGISLSIRPLILPNVLFINFKRFSAIHDENKSTMIEKNFMPVVFGLHLKFPSFTDEYELQAVIEHKGFGYNSGHYICYFKKGEFWFYSSDEKLEKVPFSKVKIFQAYILVYNKMAC